MRAADTNLLIRLLTQDDPRQFPIAREFFAVNEVFVPVTVLLEAEWVLRRTYRFERKRIASELRRLSALPSITIDQADRVLQALDWAEAGLDFADALHLAGSAECSDFVTFDAALACTAADAAPPVTFLESNG